MASAIRSAAALRQRLPRLLSSATRSVRRALEEERRFLVRRAGGPAMGDPRLFSSSSAGKSYTHPCKLNMGHKKHMEKNKLPRSLEDHLADFNMKVEKDALAWRAIRERLEAFQRREIKLEEECRREDRVVAWASAALFLALLGGNVVFG